MKKVFLVSAISASLTACIAPNIAGLNQPFPQQQMQSLRSDIDIYGHPFTPEQVQSIKPGMTVSEVTSILGKPQSISNSPNETVMNWMYSPALIPSLSAEARYASVSFRDGKVVNPKTTIKAKNHIKTADEDRYFPNMVVLRHPVTKDTKTCQHDSYNQGWSVSAFACVKSYENGGYEIISR